MLSRYTLSATAAKTTRAIEEIPFGNIEEPHARDEIRKRPALTC